MNYIASFFTSNQESQARELTQEQKDFIGKIQSNKGIFKHLDGHFIEDILCYQVRELTMSKLTAKKGAQKGQEKKCEF